MEVPPMKAFWTVMKVLAILAAIAGVIYVIATYGDKMVAWARKVLKRSRKPVFTYSTAYGEPVGEAAEVGEVEDVDFAG